MIKFIATDLDGTLLDDDRRLPRKIFPLIERLHERGVLFAPASGRQYANLKQLFAPVADKLLFICENGALIKYRGETIHFIPIRDACLKDALDVIRSLPHLHPLLCGADSAYIDDDAEPFRRLALASYTQCKRVSSLNDVIGKENICKIAVYDDLGATVNCIKALPSRLPHLRTILSGPDWCDVSAPEANKGEAVRFIRSALGFEREECAAFGDHMNDYEMLSECGHAFVTANAYPPLKNLIGNIVPSNEEGGVLIKIEEFFQKELL